MAIPVTCVGCGATYRAQEDTAGKTFNCPACGVRTRVPAVWAAEPQGQDKPKRRGRRRTLRVGCFVIAALGLTVLVLPALLRAPEYADRAAAVAWMGGPPRTMRTNVPYSPAETLARLKQCVARGMDLDVLDDAGWNELIAAATWDDGVAVEYLLAHGADVNVVSPTHGSALHQTAIHGHARLAERLLKAGALVTGGMPEGKTPLDQAASKGHKKLGTLLIAYGAKPTVHQLAALGMAGRLQTALDGSPSLATARDTHGITALHWAAYTTAPGTAEVAKLLIANGADVNAKAGPYGQTPLHSAAESGNTGVATELLKHAAQPNQPDGVGNTPVLIALHYGHVETARVIDPSLPKDYCLCRLLESALRKAWAGASPEELGAMAAALQQDAATAGVTDEELLALHKDLWLALISLREGHVSNELMEETLTDLAVRLRRLADKTSRG